jgi:hypothetical protein
MSLQKIKYKKYHQKDSVMCGENYNRLISAIYNDQSYIIEFELESLLKSQPNFNNDVYFIIFNNLCNYYVTDEILLMLMKKIKYSIELLYKLLECNRTNLMINYLNEIINKMSIPNDTATNDTATNEIINFCIINQQMYLFEQIMKTNSNFKKYFLEKFNNLLDESYIEIMLLFSINYLNEYVNYFWYKIPLLGKYILLYKSERARKIIENFIIKNINLIDLFAVDNCGNTIVKTLINYQYNNIINNQSFKIAAGYSDQRFNYFLQKCGIHPSEYIIMGHGGSGEYSNIDDSNLQKSFTIVPKNCCFVFMTLNNYFNCSAPEYYGNNIKKYIENLIKYGQCRIYTQNTLIPNISINLHETIEDTDKCGPSGIIPLEKFDKAIIKQYDKTFLNKEKCNYKSYEYHDGATFGHLTDCDNNIIQTESHICDQLHISKLFKSIKLTNNFVFYSLQCRQYDHGYKILIDEFLKYKIPEFQQFFNKLQTYQFENDDQFNLKKQYTLTDFDSDYGTKQQEQQEQQEQQSDNFKLGNKIIEIYNYVKSIPDLMKNVAEPYRKMISSNNVYENNLTINTIKELIRVYAENKKT